MNILKKIVRGRIVRRIASGIVDAVPVASTLKENIKSELNGEGKIDWLRLFVSFSTSVILILLLYWFVKGHISMEELMQLIKIIK